MLILRDEARFRFGYTVVSSLKQERFGWIRRYKTLRTGGIIKSWHGFLDLKSKSSGPARTKLTTI